MATEKGMSQGLKLRVLAALNVRAEARTYLKSKDKERAKTGTMAIRRERVVSHPFHNSFLFIGKSSSSILLVGV